MPAAPQTHRPDMQEAGRRRRIGWILLSPLETPQPSTRIAAVNMMAELPAHGYTSGVLYAPECGRERPDLPPIPELLARIESEGFDVIVFQKVHGDSVLAFMRALRARGIKTVYMVCDLILPEMADIADITLVVCDYLRTLYPAALQHKVKVVHDGIERGDLFKSEYSANRGSRGQPLNAVMVTNASMSNLGAMGLPPSWLDVTVLGRYPCSSSFGDRVRNGYHALAMAPGLRARMEYLRFAASPRVDMKPWSQAGAYEALLAADIGVIAVQMATESEADGLPPSWMRRSENRLTLKMSLGLAVIASPVPSYLDVVEQGLNGFIATTPADWRRCLEALRDPDLRRSMGTRARESVTRRFSKARQAEELAKALDLVCKSRR